MEYRIFPGPFISVFGLNTEINRVNLRIETEYVKIQTRKNSAFGIFSCIGTDLECKVINFNNRDFDVLHIVCQICFTQLIQYFCQDNLQQTKYDFEIHISCHADINSSQYFCYSKFASYPKEHENHETLFPSM